MNDFCELTLETKRYVLTDGHEDVEVRMMTEAEAYEANCHADVATDGNWYWSRSDLPMTNREGRFV